MLVNIRDDDTNYYTSPDDLKQAYGEFLGKIPITIAVIPFVSEFYFRMLKIKGKNRSDKLKTQRIIEKGLDSIQLGLDQKFKPVGENNELVDFLIKLMAEGKFEIALHGYNHRYYENGAEFLNDNLSIYHLRDGKEYLQKVFNCNIEFFVPPSNAISFDAFKWLFSLNLSLLNSASISTSSIFQRLSLIIKKGINNPIFILNKITKRHQRYHYKLEKTFALNSVTFGIDDNATAFMDRHRSDMLRLGYISIATHYMPLRDDESYRNEFHQLLSNIQKEFPSTSFVSASEIKSYLLEK